MEEKLDLFLKILNEASGSKSLSNLTKIQEELQEISNKLKEEINNESKIDNEKVLEKLHLINNLIRTLENNNSVDNKLFEEFKSFIESRKIK